MFWVAIGNLPIRTQAGPHHSAIGGAASLSLRLVWRDTPTLRVSPPRVLRGSLLAQLLASPVEPIRSRGVWPCPIAKKTVHRFAGGKGEPIPQGSRACRRVHSFGSSIPKGNGRCALRWQSGLSSLNSRLGWMPVLCWYLSLE